MDLSIIILNYKTKGLLKNCLKGIKLFPPNLDFEVIVVDNASSDGTVEMMRENYPEIKLITSEKNLGFAGGMNLGMKNAQGQYFLLMNPDIAVVDNSIEKLYDFMERHPAVGLASPRLINPDGSIQTSCRQFPTPLTFVLRRTPLGRLSGGEKKLKKFLMVDFDHSQNQPVDWLIGACLIVRRKAVDKVGKMDEHFFLYLEDTDWGRRFWQAGWRVYYVAEAKMVHYHRRESAVNPDLKGLFSYPTRVHILSGIKYFIKYLGKPLPQIKS